jgi:hypothetical protein
LNTNNHINQEQKSLQGIFTCPATAKPSARSDDVNQTCKQIWKAAIVVEPSRAALDAARVTQIVAAITRANNRNPASSREMKLEKMH